MSYCSVFNQCIIIWVCIFLVCLLDLFFEMIRASNLNSLYLLWGQENGSEDKQVATEV
jgi:hypothetical protein